jgi:hypothetical protein
MIVDVTTEDSVLIDLRTYRVKPGRVKPQLEIYAKHGFATQTRYLGQPLAYLQCENGELNTIVHLWAYDDVTDRATKRAAMFADPEWQNWLKIQAEAEHLVAQSNNLMVPTSFWPSKP